MFWKRQGAQEKESCENKDHQWAVNGISCQHSKEVSPCDTKENSHGDSKDNSAHNTKRYSEWSIHIDSERVF